MYCKSCDSQIPDEAVFCPNCGTLVEENDLEATALLVEEDKEATGLLNEESSVSQPVYTPSQSVYEHQQQMNTDDINPAYVNPMFNHQSSMQTQRSPYNSVQQPFDTLDGGYAAQTEIIEQVSFKTCFKKFWQNYTNFSGRSRRSEYWYVVLANVLISFVNIIPYVGQALYCLYALAIIVPMLALIVRRLHDLGKEWYNIFFVLIPIAGAIILLVWMLKDSQIGENQFGANPKGINF